MGDGRIAGRYRFAERLGTGGMSEVWRAEDEELERTVAVKLLRRDADHARFEREARAVAVLSHPNINQLYDYGEADGRPYMVLEYLPGGSLEERLQPRMPLADAETARIATDIASGLAHAHSHGLIHRDLKPANVLFDAEGRAKLADFGIARLGGAGTLTEAGTVLGTAAFISPEQASGEGATPASDVYSFGVILFRLLTGRLPFESNDALALAAMHVTEPAPALHEIRTDVPAALEGIAVACLAKDPRERPPDGTALLRELTAAAPTTALAAAADPTEATVAAGAAETRVLQRPRAPGPPPQPPPRPPGRRLGPVAAFALLLLVGAAGVAVAVLATRSSSTSTPTATGVRPSLSLPKVTRERTHAATTEAPTPPPSTTQPQTTTKKPPPTTAPPPPPPTTATVPTLPTTIATTATLPPTTPTPARGG